MGNYYKGQRSTGKFDFLKSVRNDFAWNSLNFTSSQKLTEHKLCLTMIFSQRKFDRSRMNHFDFAIAFLSYPDSSSNISERIF